jgi:hypothetical protein
MVNDRLYTEQELRTLLLGFTLEHWLIWFKWRSKRVLVAKEMKKERFKLNGKNKYYPVFDAKQGSGGYRKMRANNEF